jgi:general secretion pathway protein M
MSFATTIAQYRERANAMWLSRTEQERRFLAIGGAVVLLALLYLILVDPAVEGRAQLRRQLPQPGQLAAAPATQATPLTRETVSTSLSGRSLTPQSLSMTGEYIKLQLNNVSFANLATWLDEQRRANRVLVQDAVVTALPVAGQVDASLTLRQNTGATQ